MTGLPDYSRLDCVTNGTAESWAVLSADGTYRYLLARMWDDYLSGGNWWERDAVRPLMVFVMLNPSTATGLVDDPTIRKCVGFARRHQCGGILVVNLFAWRETYPKNLPMGPEAVGPHNEEFMHIALGNPLLAPAVGAWGTLGSKRLREQAKALIATAKCARRLWCFGKSKDGEPRHPLMLAYDTPLVSMADGKPWFSPTISGPQGQGVES